MSYSNVKEFLIESPFAYPLSSVPDSGNFETPNNTNMAYVLQRASIGGEGFTSVTVRSDSNLANTKYENLVKFTFIDNGTTTDGFMKL